MRRASLAVMFTTALVLAACSTADDPSVDGEGTAARPTGTTAPPTTSPAADPTPTATDSDGPGTAAPTTPIGEARARWDVVGERFEGPVQVLTLPDGRVVVVEQVGRLRSLTTGNELLDLTSRVTVGQERGLFAAAVHPDAGRLFLHYSGRGGRTVVSSFPLGDGPLDPGEETVLFEQEQPAANHNGGSLLFDPDGHLVLALGDGGAAGDRFGNGQDPGTVLGALLRFDADGPELAPAPGNPFLDGGGAPEVWAYGLRNPWRIAFTEDRVYVADVGQDAVEEVNVVARDEVAGANFGWPILEGTSCHASADCDTAGTVLPVAELRHDEGACAIIGGVVVPDGHPTGLGGAYLYSDRCDTRLRALRVEGSGDVEPAVVSGAPLPASPLGFGRGADGEVWVGTSDGDVLELGVG